MDLGVQVGVRIGKKNHANNDFEGVGTEGISKKESPYTMGRTVLRLLKHCQMDEVKDLLKKGRRTELVEWLKIREHDTDNVARDMERLAKLRCHMVPETAEVIIRILADAERFDNVQSISRSDSMEIAMKAKRYLKETQ